MSYTEKSSNTEHDLHLVVEVKYFKSKHILLISQIMPLNRDNIAFVVFPISVTAVCFLKTSTSLSHVQRQALLLFFERESSSSLQETTSYLGHLGKQIQDIQALIVLPDPSQRSCLLTK